MNNHKHSLQTVANKTGLSPVLIRAWENRYNAINPERSSSNRRLYAEEDVEKLKLLKIATDNGHLISTIAHLSIENLYELVLEDNKDKNYKFDKSVSSAFEAKINQKIDDLIDLIKELDTQNFSQALNLLSVDFNQTVIIEEIIIPILKKMGGMWEKGDLKIVHEHFATSQIRNYLSNIIESVNISDSAPLIIITTPKGQYHELGAFIAAAVAVSEGWKVTYLGPNLPSEEISYAVEKLNPDAVYLSIIYPFDDPQIESELKNLRRNINDNTSILVGGRAVWSYRETIINIGATYSGDTLAMRKALKKLLASSSQLSN